MEELMQFVWQHGLWNSTPLTTASGEKEQIINQGQLNRNSGPDFFNAAVKIGGQVWYGNVELHLRASDWFRHGHQDDPAYDSVILHVVQVDDAVVRRPDGSAIPQVTVRCSPEAARRCNAMMMSASASLPCASTIASMPPARHCEWLTALAVERLQNKSERILSMVKLCEGDWEAAAYITLARALGFGLNGEPFEILAKNLPLRFLNRHRDELITVEALLFGQAGMIPTPRPDEDGYVTRLRDEYRFMAHKFRLEPPPLQWKMSRIRPQNFPYRRVAMLAEVVHRGFAIIGRLDDLLHDLRDSRESSVREAALYYSLSDQPGFGALEPPVVRYTPSLTDIRGVFDVRLTGFWATHFTFATGGGATPKALSASALDRIIINVAIPLLIARADYTGDYDALGPLPELLHEFPLEDNRDVRLFCSAGIRAVDAFDSQALIQLRREYCEKNKCIYCRFGHRMLAREFN